MLSERPAFPSMQSSPSAEQLTEVTASAPRAAMAQATRRAIQVDSEPSSVSSQLERGIDHAASDLISSLGTPVQAVSKGWLWDSRVTIGFDVSTQLYALIEGLYK